MTMELVTIEKKSIAKEVFDIPAGFPFFTLRQQQNYRKEYFIFNFFTLSDEEGKDITSNYSRNSILSKFPPGARCQYVEDPVEPLVLDHSGPHHLRLVLLLG